MFYIGSKWFWKAITIGKSLTFAMYEYNLIKHQEGACVIITALFVLLSSYVWLVLPSKLCQLFDV